MASFYKIPDHYRGDTFNGVQFTVSVNAAPLNLTGYEIKADFKGHKGTFRLSLGSGISIVNAANGVFQIDQQIIDWNSGVYNYDIQFSNGTVIKTYIYGTFEVLKDITRG